MKGKLFQAGFVNADLNKACLSRIIKKPTTQPDTASTPDKNDETKQTQDCVYSPSMDQNDLNKRYKNITYFIFCKNNKSIDYLNS